MSGYCSIPDCARLGEENGLCELHDRVRLQRDLAAANLDNARKTYEINRLVGERAAERERADIAEALATVREMDADRMRQRAEAAEATLAKIAERLTVTPDSDIYLFLDVRLRRYEHDSNVSAAAELRQTVLDLRTALAEEKDLFESFRHNSSHANALDAELETCSNCPHLKHIGECYPQFDCSCKGSPAVRS